MNESIPCPFCGSEDYYIAVTDNPFSYDTYSTAHCSKCHATGPFVAESYLEDEPKPTRDYMEAVAKEKWQTRPIEDALNKRIADLVSSNMVMAKGVLDLKARIAELEAEIDIRKDQLREAKNILIDKKLHIDALYEEGYKLQQRIAELEAEIDHLTAHDATERQDDKWIPVSERLPETDGQYIGYTNTGLVGTHWLVDGHFVVTYSCERNWLTTPTSWILESASGGDVYVTHWMPLPESPNDTQTDSVVYGKESD